MGKFFFITATFWTVIGAKSSNLALAAVLMAYWSQYAINMLVYSVTSKPYRQAYKLLYTDLWKAMTVAKSCAYIKSQKAPDIVIYMDIKLIPRRARNVMKWNENEDIFHTQNAKQKYHFETQNIKQRQHIEELVSDGVVSRSDIQISFFAAPSRKVLILHGSTGQGDKSGRRHSSGEIQDFTELGKKVARKQKNKKIGLRDGLTDVGVEDFFKSLTANDITIDSGYSISTAANLKLVSLYNVKAKVNVLSFQHGASCFSVETKSPFRYHGSLRDNMFHNRKLD